MTLYFSEWIQFLFLFTAEIAESAEFAWCLCFCFSGRLTVGTLAQRGLAASSPGR